MNILIGIVLVIYSIAALIILYRWWGSLSRFLKELLGNVDGAIADAYNLLPPIQDVAANAKSATTDIHRIADEITDEVIPGLSGLSNDLNDLHETIIELRNDTDPQLNAIGTEIHDTVKGAADFLKKEGEQTLPKLVSTLRKVAATIGELDYAITEETIDKLIATGLPSDVANKLGLMIDLQFKDISSLETAVKEKLSPDDYSLYFPQIEIAARNPNKGDGVVGDMSTAISAINHIAGTTIQSAADSIPNLADGYFALVGIGVGPTAPVAQATIATADVFAKLKILLRTFDVKVPAGHFNVYNIETVKPQLIQYFLNLPNLPGPLPDLPSVDIKKPDLGYAIDIQIPPTDLDLLLGSELWDSSLIDENIANVLEGATKIKNAVLNAAETSNKLKDTATKLKESGRRLGDIASRLSTRTEQIRDRVELLRARANDLSSTAAGTLNQSIQLEIKAGEILKKITDFTKLFVEKLEKASNNVATASKTVSDIDLTAAVKHIHDGADNILRAAARIDDGTPIGTVGKSDFVQMLNNSIKKIRASIPSLNSVTGVVKPAFLLLGALHVAVFVAGIWLIIRR
jgi:gas vesicle protein